MYSINIIIAKRLVAYAYTLLSNVIIIINTVLTHLGSRGQQRSILALHNLLLHPASPRHNEHHTTMTYDCH